MGKLQAQDVQVSENTEDPQRVLVRETNRQFRRLVSGINDNYSNPVALNFSVHQSGALWLPQEPFLLTRLSLLSIGAITLNDVTDMGVTIPNDVVLPFALTAGVQYDINFTPEHPLDDGHNVSLWFSAALANNIAVALTVRRLG